MSRNSKETLNGFSDVDGSKSPRSFVAYLNKSNSFEALQMNKFQLINRLGARKGDRILDIGCGVGHDSRTLAQWVGPTGYVIGVDRSKTMIRAARRAVRHLNLPLDFRLGDIHRLDFEDSTFDACLASKVFLHIEHPRKAVSEIVRVLKPGACLAALEPDFDTLAIRARDRTAARQLTIALQQSVRHGGIGHRLPVLFKQAGLTNITVELSTCTMSDYFLANEVFRIEAAIKAARATERFSPSRIGNLLRDLQSGGEASFLATLTGFAVFGTRPTAN